MSIKSGELIHVGNQVLVDRAQTAGPGSLNIPTEKIYELGNYQSVATIRDIPDLSFTLESFDVSAEIESMLLGRDFAALAEGAVLDLSATLPVDVVSEFKAGKTAVAPFQVEASVAIPFLTCESVSYRFGMHDSAAQTITLKGDSIYYAAASAYVQEVVGTATAAQAILLTNPVVPYNGDVVAGTRYALSVSLAKSGKRLTLGTDYTEAGTGTDPNKVVTVTVLAAVPVTDTIRITYQSLTKAVYPQVSHALASAVRPAAIKGRHIEVRVGGVTVTDRWSSVQSASATYKVTLQKDEEFGNSVAVAQDYDVPEVSGEIEIKPRDSAELLARIRQIAGVPVNEVVGPDSTVVLPLEIILHSPDTGVALKTLYIPDARFTLPGYSGRVQQKLSVTFNYESDGGTLLIYKGSKP